MRQDSLVGSKRLLIRMRVHSVEAAIIVHLVLTFKLFLFYFNCRKCLKGHTSRRSSQFLWKLFTTKYDTNTSSSHSLSGPLSRFTFASCYVHNLTNEKWKHKLIFDFGVFGLEWAQKREGGDHISHQTHHYHYHHRHRRQQRRQQHHWRLMAQNLVGSTTFL